MGILDMLLRIWLFAIKVALEGKRSPYPGTCKELSHFLVFLFFKKNMLGAWD